MGLHFQALIEVRLTPPKKKLFNNKVMAYIKKTFYAIEILILPL